MSQPLSIRTSHEQAVCDLCTRTLLRGERAEVFVGGGRRYSVCELCKPHALHEGWIREGSVPEFEGGGERVQRRRALFGRRRGKGEGGVELQVPEGPRTLDDELSLEGWDAGVPGQLGVGEQLGVAGQLPAIAAGEPLLPAPAVTPRGSGRVRDREPRHVHAVPTSGDHKIAAAAEVFNAGSHRRTVAGVARSLGAPTVNLTPDQDRSSLVWIVVSWELCWYRYEVDLADPQATARLDGQGYELAELAEHELYCNAGADESGALIPL